VTEDGAGNLVFTFTRVGVTGGALTVDFAVGGTAVFGTDYAVSGAASFSSSAGTVNFAPGSASATVTVDPVADSTAEFNETVQLTVTSGSNYHAASPVSASGFINDDDSNVSVAVSPASMKEDAPGGLVFTFTRSGLTTNAVTVNFTVGGTENFPGAYAQSGAATFTTTAGTVAMAAGATTATVTVDPNADFALEPDRTVILTVTGGSGYTVGSPVSATATIENDDTLVSVSVAPSSVMEDGAANLVFTFTRAGVTDVPLTANFSVGGTAALSSDYAVTGAGSINASAGTVFFPTGVTTASVTVDPVADTVVEPDETVILTPTAGTGYQPVAPATGTITADDTDVTVYVAETQVTEDGIVPLYFSFTRSGVISNALTVNFTVGGTAGFGSDFTQSGAASFSSTAGSVTFAAGNAFAAVSLDPTADATPEPDETVTLTIITGSGYLPGFTATYTGTIVNDDFPPEIAVEQPSGSGLTSGVSTSAFGPVLVNAPATKTFTIRNLGTVPLTGTGVSVSGANAGRFSFTQPAATVNGGGSATFTLTFTPIATGSQSATLQIASNDSDENPFSISLTGTGSTARQLFDIYASAGGLSGLNAEPGAIPSNDGVANLLKYAFNMNAAGVDVRTLVPGTGTAGLPVVRYISGTSPVIRYEFIRRKNSGLTYTPRQSSGLTTGSWQAATGTNTVTQMDATWERVVIEQPYSVGTARRFLQMQVNLE
jgi:hypothetical protein